MSQGREPILAIVESPLHSFHGPTGTPRHAAGTNTVLVFVNGYCVCLNLTVTDLLELDSESTPSLASTQLKNTKFSFSTASSSTTLPPESYKQKANNHNLEPLLQPISITSQPHHKPFPSTPASPKGTPSSPIPVHKKPSSSLGSHPTPLTHHKHPQPQPSRPPQTLQDV
jgi:hypothetical protein